MRSHEDQVAAPTRACAACRQRRPTNELVRLVAEGSRVVPDLRRRRGGRGIHLCPERACFELAAKKRAYGRTLRERVRVDVDELRADVARAAAERLAALLDSSRRSGAVATAADIEAVEPQELRSLVAASEGRVGTTKEGVVTVLEPALAQRVRWLAATCQLFTLKGGGAMNRRPASGASSSSLGPPHGAPPVVVERS